MKHLLSKVIYFFVGIVFAQSYQPIDTLDNSIRELKKETFIKSHNQYTEIIKNEFSKRDRKNLIQGLDEFRDDFAEQIESGKFVYDERFTNKIQEIVNEIQTKNPSYNINVNFLVAKEWSVNAFCLYDGTLVVHMGTFYFLNNEDQLASVISHEIAHYLLKHSLKSQKRSLAQRAEDRKKKTVKNLKKEQYNLSEKAFRLFQKRLYESGKLNRKHEHEADSLGFALYKNTKYHTNDFVNALDLIHRFDTIQPQGVENSIYKKLFDLPNQPFKEKWMKMEDFSSYDYSKYKEKFDEDSLSTHPEPKARIDYLSKIFGRSVKIDSLSNATKEFKELQETAYYEAVPNLYFNKEYGRAVYLSLWRIQNQREAEFHKKWLGKSFAKIAEARKEYKLNRYLDRIVPNEQSESYQQFLSFMWNLSLKEIQAIADYYNKSET